MTLLKKLGLAGPYSKLSRADQNLYQKEYRKAHRDRYRMMARRRYDPTKARDNWSKYVASLPEGELSKRQRNSYKKNPIKFRKKSLEWAQKNPEGVKKIRKSYYARNRDREIARSTSYRIGNIDKVRARDRVWAKEKYHTDPGFKIAGRLRVRLAELVKKKDQHASVTLKLDKGAIVAHLENLFKPGMSWANHGKVWHIDHIIPCAEFDLTDPRQVEQCFGLHNLQPLWARENIQKGKKLNWMPGPTLGQ